MQDAVEKKWVQTTHIRNAPTIEFGGQVFEVVALGTIRKCDRCATLRVNHKQMNTMDTADFFNWGFSPEALRKRLLDKEVRKAVVECTHSGLWSNLRGRQYSWQPEVEIQKDGQVVIDITVGFTLGEETMKGLNAQIARMIVPA